MYEATITDPIAKALRSKSRTIRRCKSACARSNLGTIPELAQDLWTRAV